MTMYPAQHFFSGNTRFVTVSRTRLPCPTAPPGGHLNIRPIGFLNAYFSNWYTGPAEARLPFTYNALRTVFGATHEKTPGYWKAIGPVKVRRPLGAVAPPPPQSCLRLYSVLSLSMAFCNIAQIQNRFCVGKYKLYCAVFAFPAPTLNMFIGRVGGEIAPAACVQTPMHLADVL